MEGDKRIESKGRRLHVWKGEIARDKRRIEGKGLKERGEREIKMERKERGVTKFESKGKET